MIADLTRIYDASVGLNEQGIFPAREVVTHALGIDLGRQQDYTAISLVERRVTPVPLDVEGSVDSATLRQRVYPPRYTVRLLERIPLGTDYVEQARRVAQMVGNAYRQGLDLELVVDKTGVGVAVVDIFRRDFGLRLTGITITSGKAETQDGSDWSVPKLTLVSTLQAAFARGDLKIVPTLPEAAALSKELSDFQVKLTDLGNITTGARSGSHDDLVLSVAVGLWKLARRGGGFASQTVMW